MEVRQQKQDTHEQIAGAIIAAIEEGARLTRCRGTLTPGNGISACLNKEVKRQAGIVLLYRRA